MFFRWGEGFVYIEFSLSSLESGGRCESWGLLFVRSFCSYLVESFVSLEVDIDDVTKISSIDF